MNKDNQNNLAYFKELRIKDLQVLLDCSERTAKRRMFLIKKHFELDSILLFHFYSYYKIPLSFKWCQKVPNSANFKLL